MALLLNNVLVDGELNARDTNTVRVATTTAGTLASSFENGDTIDGVVLSTGDRILIKDQSTASENGIYVVESTGAPTRAEDLETGDSANGIFIWVREGTANASTGWLCTSAVGSDIVDTNNLTFTQFDVIDTLAVSRGGTGATSFTSGNVLVGAGTSAVTATKSAPTGDFVGTTDTQTLTNKTLTSPVLTTPEINDTSADHQYIFTVNELTSDRNVELPLLTGNDTFVFEDHTQTLTNKTLTSPAIGTSILDTNGNELFNLTATALAVNEITYANSASGSNPTFEATGDDANVGITFQTKGTGTFDYTDGSNTLSINVGTLTGDITLSAPTSGGTIATETYVDSVAQGLDVKESCRVATTVDLSTLGTGFAYNNTGGSSGRGQFTWTSGPTTIDGISINNGDRILVKDNSPGDENGIWVRTSATVWDRATDFDQDSEVSSGAFTFIEEGTANSDNGYVLSTPDPITIGGAGGTALTFTQFSGAGQIIAGDGIQKSGNTLSVDLKTNGGLVIEATEIAVDLSATNITGLLAVGDGGTGAISFTSGNVLVGAGTSAITATKAAPTGDFVGTTDTQTLTNKTLTSPVLTSPEINDTSADHQYIFTVNELTLDRNIELPLLTGDDTFVFEAHTQTLTNKTLTSPIIGTSILDTNGNELFILTATASAVNEITYANAATGANPSFTASGSDAVIGIDFQSKSTGKYNFLGTTDGPSEMRLFEDLDNGSNYIGIDVPASVVTSYTLTLPATDGSNGDVLQTDGSGNLSFVTPSTGRVAYHILNQAASATSNSYQTIGYFSWNDSRYSSYTSGALIFEVVIGNRDLDIRLRDTTNAANVIEVTGINASGFREETGFTNPSADGRLELQIRKSANGGNNPLIYSCQLEWQPS